MQACMQPDGTNRESLKRAMHDCNVHMMVAVATSIPSRRRQRGAGWRRSPVDWRSRSKSWLRGRSRWFEPHRTQSACLSAMSARTMAVFCAAHIVICGRCKRRVLALATSGTYQTSVRITWAFNAADRAIRHGYRSVQQETWNCMHCKFTSYACVPQGAARQQTPDPC